MPNNDTLKTSFDLPARLSVPAYAIFQRILFDGATKAGGWDKLTPILYQALAFHAAIESDMLVNWKSDIMPKLEWKVESDIEAIDVGVVEWAGQQVIEWIEAEKHVPKVSNWGRLMRLIKIPFLPRSSSSRAA